MTQPDLNEESQSTCNVLYCCIHFKAEVVLTKLHMTSDTFAAMHMHIQIIQARGPAPSLLTVYIDLWIKTLE